MGRGGRQKNATNGATITPTRSQKVDVLDAEEERRIFDMSSRTGISENDFLPGESGKREGFYKAAVPYLLSSLSAVFSRKAQVHEERNYKDDVLHKVGGGPQLLGM